MTKQEYDIQWANEVLFCLGLLSPDQQEAALSCLRFLAQSVPAAAGDQARKDPVSACGISY